MISGGKSWNIPEKTLPRGDQGQFLKLPLIDRYRSALDALQKFVVGYAFTQHSAEFRRSRPFRAGRGEQDRPSRLRDVGSGRYPFDALVKGEVQRVACRGGDRRVCRFIQHL